VANFDKKGAGHYTGSTNQHSEKKL